jgi:CelD/BcsL family acetyltransferase involved in cellulose biosynthesis
MADYEDLLIVDGYEAAVIQALCDELAKSPPGWDIVHLQELPEQSRTAEPLVSCAGDRGWIVEVQLDSDVYPLALTGDWDSYRAGLSRTTRNDTGRQTRKLVNERDGSFVTLNGDRGDIEGAMEALFELHTARWATMEKPGIFRDPHKRRFHQELARRFARRRMLMLSLLNSGDHTIAAKYGFEHAGIQYHYAGGFSTGPEWAHYRLGMILDLHTIQQAFERRMDCVDFMRGENQYKRHYHTQSSVNQQILIFRSRRARLHYEGARLLRRLTERTGRRLFRREQTGFAGKL